MITSFRAAFALFAVFAVASLAPAVAQTPSPEGAKVYFINLKDGAEVDSPFLVQFGLSGMGVAPAGVEKPNTGHHHLLIDATLTPEQLKEPIPSDDNHKHFGGGRDRSHGDLAERPAHPATRARRLDAHPARAAGDVGEDQHHGALNARRRRGRMTRTGKSVICPSSPSCKNILHQCLRRSPSHPAFCSGRVAGFLHTCRSERNISIPFFFDAVGPGCSLILNR